MFATLFSTFQRGKYISALFYCRIVLHCSQNDSSLAPTRLVVATQNPTKLQIPSIVLAECEAVRLRNFNYCSHIHPPPSSLHSHYYVLYDEYFKGGSISFPLCHFHPSVFGTKESLTKESERDSFKVPLYSQGFTFIAATIEQKKRFSSPKKRVGDHVLW